MIRRQLLITSRKNKRMLITFPLLNVIFIAFYLIYMR